MKIRCKKEHLVDCDTLDLEIFIVKEFRGLHKQQTRNIFHNK